MVEQKTKIKKKKWVQIIAPKLFKEQILGEINLVDTGLAVGRTIDVNLMNLTGNMKKQNTLVGFKVTRILDGKALTEVISYKLVPSSLKRLVRRSREKIEDSFTCATSDNKQLKIKLFLITRFAVKKSVLTALRKSANEIITKEVKKMKYGVFINSIVSGNFQRGLMDVLKKVYPMRVCEVREIKIKEEKKISEKEKLEEKKTEEPKQAPKSEEKLKEEKPKPEEKKLSNESENGLEMSEKRSFSEHAQKSSISDKSKTSQKEEKPEEVKKEPKEEKKPETKEEKIKGDNDAKANN